MNNLIYLDYNATTPARPEVIDAVCGVMEAARNPSSVHGAGRKARILVETARDQIAALVNCKPGEVIFTSGGTEANNLAVKALEVEHVLVGATEHDSILAPAGRLAAQQHIVAVDSAGLIDLEALTSLLARLDGPVLLSVMIANNETGILQPLKEIAEICHAHDVYLHCDAVQAAGKVALDFAGMGIDMMSISAHKIGGPQGIGALIVRESLPIRAQQTGGGQELGRRGGTENVAGIVGFGVAARIAADHVRDYQKIAELRDLLETEILSAAPDAVIHGRGGKRLANTLCVSMPGVESELQVMSFDLAGIAVSAGSACSSGKVKPSHVLVAMGVADDIAASAIRISLGWLTSRDDILQCAEVWKKLYRQHAAGGPGAPKHAMSVE